MPSISLTVRVCVCVFVRHTFSLHLMVFLPPLPEVGCPIFLEIRNPWGKVMERSGLTFEIFFADFALQNMGETTLPDGLKTSGQRAYR